MSKDKLQGRAPFKYKPGRPRIFETPDEFIEAANKYFDENKGGKISWNGLCLAVGASCRETLERYRNGDHGDGFIGPVKDALTVVQQYYEECVDGAKGIFILKNFGMRDNIDINADVKNINRDMTEEEIDAEIKDVQRRLRDE